MLHIVKHYTSLAEVVALASQGDALLLVEDAVYAAIPNHKSHTLVLESTLPVYLLQPDLSARGLPHLTLDNPLDGRYKLIDFSGFVSLTVAHATSMTWD